MDVAIVEESTRVKRTLARFQGCQMQADSKRTANCGFFVGGICKNESHHNSPHFTQQRLVTGDSRNALLQRRWRPGCFLRPGLYFSVLARKGFRVGSTLPSLERFFDEVLFVSTSQLSFGSLLSLCILSDITDNKYIISI